MEILEFGSIRPGFLRQIDQTFGAFQIAIMVGSNIRYEVDGLLAPITLLPIFISMAAPLFIPSLPW